MLLTVNFAVVLFMAGVGWLVQLAAYPLFASVGRDDFVEFHAGWSKRITWVVVAPMNVDLVTSIWLAIAPPAGVSRPVAIIGATLAVLTWASTALLQVPRHEELSRGFDERAHAGLVRTSWVRTAAWTAHALICCALVSSAIA